MGVGVGELVGVAVAVGVGEGGPDVRVAVGGTAVGVGVAVAVRTAVGTARTTAPCTAGVGDGRALPPQAANTTPSRRRQIEVCFTARLRTSKGDVSAPWRWPGR